MLTIRDVMREKRNEQAADEFAAMQEARAKDDLNAVLDANPGIGILFRKGKPVYYLNNPYREAGDPRELF